MKEKDFDKQVKSFIDNPIKWVNNNRKATAWYIIAQINIISLLVGGAMLSVQVLPLCFMCTMLMIILDLM